MTVLSALQICLMSISGGFGFTTVCHKDNLDCWKQNIRQPGILQFERCQSADILRRLSRISILECVKECMVTSHCTGINYRHLWLMCDTLGDSKDLTSEINCVYSAIKTWDKGFAGECEFHTCNNGEKCFFDGEIPKCEPVFCVDSPYALNAVSAERFGTYRNIGAAVKFKCEHGYELKGQPYSECQPTGQWENWFTCVKKEKCSDKWISVLDKCFLIEYEKVEWKQAVMKCKESGGHLAKIENEFEDSWLISQLTDGAWIGLNDIGNEGQWHWISDSSGINYTNWLLAEPNGFETENCVSYCKDYCHRTSYGWNDERCNLLQGYVCERHFDMFN
ncbi:MRC [Mytilus coruscus]|uniref:MRC n=1 Tax=Mytilus coruscus TaxID=42192 RepID=A0A6J8CQ55_MYTCO|nr:MRC [Mytilus coruscus]